MKNIKTYIIYAVIFCVLVTLISACMEPPNPYDLSVEEQIKYEQMIFP